MSSSLARRAARSTASFVAGLALLAGSVGAAQAQATVDVGSPSGALSTAHLSSTLPVTLTRTDATPILGFSVEFTLSGNLSLSAGLSSITLGGFLGASGGTPNLQVRDLGAGRYAADAVTLGAPCGSAATSGTLFTVTVSSTDPGSTGTITIDDVTLRDCSNATLASSIGSAGSVSIDNTLPVVAVTSPNGGESWVGGAEHTITWSATDASGFSSNAIDLEWSSNGGSSWSPIATSVSNSGSRPWTLPSTPTHSALVRVTARDQYDNPTTDASNAVFSILNATTTSVTSAANPSVVGESVTLTATVSPAAASGTVEFFDGVSSLGSQTVAAGSAAMITSALALGSHSITAVYSGDADYGGSTSAVHSHVVNMASVSVALVAAPDPGIYLDAETLTATLTPAAATGSVEFFDGATSLGTAPVSAGTAALINNTLSVGPHSLRADYLGDSNYEPGSSPLVPLEVKARITATAGANGQIAPAGAVLVSLNGTPSFTFAADPGYHVTGVTVDALPVAITSPYTFAPVSSNHTIDVQFTANPPVPAISTLAATTQVTGNGPTGIQRIRLDWTTVPVGSTVEVWRAPFGNYPEYDDAPGPGSTPAAPSYPPPSPWTVTTVTAPGTADIPPARDFYYYVAFVTDGFGTRSPVSNVSNGALAYALGDVSDGVTAGQGDNLVDVADISLLGSVYGRLLTPGDAYAYLDVGPTTDFSVRARPATDNRLNFEDLVLFGVNFGLVSAPAAAARPAAGEHDELRLDAPANVALGTEVDARLSLLGSGIVHGLSIQLSWDSSVVEPVGQAAGEGLLSRHGVLMSPEPGAVDMMVLGAASPGLTGSVALASVQFRVLRSGEPAIRVSDVDARDVTNHHVQVQGSLAVFGGPSQVTRFAPPTPMPFSDRTALVFSLSTRGDVELAVFSVDGRLVRTLASGSHEPGEYRLEWNGSDDEGRPVPSGAYFARLKTPNGRFTRKLTYIR